MTLETKQNIDGWLTAEISKVVDETYRKVDDLYRFHGITKDDLERMSVECPKHMNRIREIENLIGPPLSLKEVEDLCHRWFKNWQYVFERRNLIKGMQTKANQKK